MEVIWGGGGRGEDKFCDLDIEDSNLIVLHEN